jgi:lantibiotic biosynthesis protein
MSALADPTASASRNPPTTHWKPILEGDLSAAARDALFDIAHALPAPGLQGTDATLSNGEAGLAVFHAYLSQCGLPAPADAERHSELMLAHIQSAVDKLPIIADRLDLFSGFMGVAWAVNHLQSLCTLQDGEELCDAADQTILDGLSNHSDSMLCELIAGLSGIGVYGLARWHRPAGQEIVSRVVRALEESAVIHQGLRTWFHAPAKLSAYALHSFPDGCFNLGLAHGVPGAMAFLARAAAHRVPGARELLAEAGDWLFRQQRQFRNGSRFGYSFLSDPEHEPDGSRVAWCYGDLGLSAAVLLCARHAGHAEWETAALDLARGTTRRRTQDSGVVDAGLCHGAFGNAHILGRMYAATGDRHLSDAALHWIREGLRMRNEGTGLAGFLSWWPLMPGESARDLWQPSAGMIDGICGIGLALMGFLTPVEPAWDEVFMVNIPSRHVL